MELSNNVYTLPHDMKAWNVDGSASDKAGYNRSWISVWEETTGKMPGRCSYSDCHNHATVGGHVWIARSGVHLAPICTSCNHPQNVQRMQGANAFLRAGTWIFKKDYTNDMAQAPRNLAIPVCDICGQDISQLPSSYTLCSDCIRAAQDPFSRCCQDCQQDISERPDHHVQCLRCYRKSQKRRTRQDWTTDSGPVQNDRRRKQRNCRDCGNDITDRPTSHTQCWMCFQSTTTRRCEVCQDDISDRPENHVVCLQCYRSKQPRRFNTSIQDEYFF
mmetsp:Transcript_18344/g.35051  ORF Transcript_18344/g.35051 Transcript_18344/m.35051 type:complete len:274 (-) Transcript_18344:49-870(-)